MSDETVDARSDIHMHAWIVVVDSSRDEQILVEVVAGSQSAVDDVFS
jgi:hypothetical protein